MIRYEIIRRSHHRRYHRIGYSRQDCWAIAMIAMDMTMTQSQKINSRHLHQKSQILDSVLLFHIELCIELHL